MTEGLMLIWAALHARKRRAADLARELQARQAAAERRLRVLQKRAELHST